MQFPLVAFLSLITPIKVHCLAEFPSKQCLPLIWPWVLAWQGCRMVAQLHEGSQDTAEV